MKIKNKIITILYVFCVSNWIHTSELPETVTSLLLKQQSELLAERLLLELQSEKLFKLEQWQQEEQKKINELRKLLLEVDFQIKLQEKFKDKKRKKFLQKQLNEEKQFLKEELHEQSQLALMQETLQQELLQLKQQQFLQESKLLEIQGFLSLVDF